MIKKTSKSKTGTKTRSRFKSAPPKRDSLPKLLEKAQKVFNKYVRDRDEGLTCISCGGNNANQAGHYFPVKGFAYLRFNEWNVNRQCPGCNMWLHGNQAMYRIGLVKKIGEKAVMELEAEAISHRIYKFSIQEVKDIIKKYES